MAGNIKGITIEFRGDTTRLDKALRQVNNETRQIDRELRNVEKALKFNPTSVDLWRQKQTLLTQKISETRDKLMLLKQQQAAMDAQGVDKQSLEYQKLQREIIETESKLKTFEGQLRKIGNVNLKAASEQFKQWGTQLENAGRQMQGLSMAAGALVASLGAISYKAGQNADDLNTLSKVYSINTQDLQKYKVAADLVDVSVEDIAKSHIRLEKAMYGAQTGSAQQAEAFSKLGVSVTNADGSLREADAVWQDTIAALGRMANETERDALAQVLMGKTAANLNPLIEDQGETYKRVADTMAQYNLDFVDQETLDKANQFNDQLDTMKVLGSVAIAQVGSELAAYLVPALEKVVGWVGKFANWLSNLSPQALTVIAIIASIVAALAPVLIILGKLSMGISAIINLVNIVGPVIGGLAGPIGIAIAAIAAIIAIGVLLYKNWDTIKAKAIEVYNKVRATFTTLKASITSIFNSIKSTITSVWNGIKSRITQTVSSVVSTVVGRFRSLWSTVSSIWNAIKTAIMNPIQTAYYAVSNAISAIRRILSGRLSFPRISIPHFSISGRFSLDPPSVPHISVSWYKNGGIFDSPTLAGIGEAGPEAVVPLDKFWEKMDKIAAAATGTNENVTINVYASQGMDVNELALKIEQRLVLLQKQRAKAYGTI